MIVKQVETRLPTRWGQFRMIAFSENIEEKMPHLAMVHEGFDPSGPVHLRIHSECLTGDLFGSDRCDCGDQMDGALKMAAEKGGVVLYLRQEGRGIGLINKLKAYNLQDTGLDTIDANVHLGLEVDARQYGIAIDMMNELGITAIHLITNNPLKIDAIRNSSIEVVSRVPLIIGANHENTEYLMTKEVAMGHFLNYRNDKKEK